MFTRKTSLVVAMALVGAGGIAFAQAPKAPAAKAPAAAPAPLKGTDLEKAYKRDFAFWEAERSTLRQRLKETEAETARRVQAAKAEIEKLQSEILGVSVQSDRLNQLVADAERKVDSLSEGSDVLDSMLAQAGSRLEKWSIKLPEVKPEDTAGRIAQIQFAFTQAGELLRKAGSVRKEQGGFFAPDGTRADGTIVRVGQVAAYGVTDRLSGALAPAGEGKFKLWPTETGDAAARGVVSGTPPGSLPMFLFDSLDKDAEQRQGKTIKQILDAGGLIGMITLLLGALAALLALVRAAILWRSAANTEKLVDELTPMVESGDIGRATEVARRARNAPGRVLQVTLENLKRAREHLEDAISEAILRESSTIDRFGAAILVTASVAPLLGLLGTVTGMISTFDIITEYGTGNPKLLSGGISEALVTTEFGLIVAIPLVVIGNILNGWAERIKDDMEKAALRIGNISNGIKVRSYRTQPVRGSSGAPPSPVETVPAS